MSRKVFRVFVFKESFNFFVYQMISLDLVGGVLVGSYFSAGGALKLTDHRASRCSLRQRDIAHEGHAWGISAEGELEKKWKVRGVLGWNAKCYRGEPTRGIFAAAGSNVLEGRISLKKSAIRRTHPRSQNIIPRYGMLLHDKAELDRPPRTMFSVSVAR